MSKALTDKNPWAYLICAGIKDIENRTWKLPEKYKGQRVLIHASGQLCNPEFTIEQERAVKRLMPINDVWRGNIQGAIIGSVEIVDCVINHSSIWAEKTEFEQVNPIIVRITGKPIYNWVLKNAIMFEKPIYNVKGKLSFWDYPEINTELDEGVEQCMCQLSVEEKDQVMIMPDGFRCRYCGGNWYK